jgi:hypothetical protein
MTLTVVSDPLDPNCNSYASLDDAQSYATDMVLDPSVGDSWGNLDVDVQARYLVNATRIVDNLFEWIGDKYSYDQKLNWPRSNAFVQNFPLLSNIVPDQVKWAVIETAFWIMQNDGGLSQTTNFSLDKMAVGPIRIDFNEKAGGSAFQYVPDIVYILLQDYGNGRNPNKPGATQAKTARLYRA